MLRRIGEWCFTHRWLTLALWVVAMVGVSAIAGSPACSRPLAHSATSQAPA